MFPKLTPLQWLIAIAFLSFYGFAVFALTRDYYLRHPPRPALASATTTAAAGADAAALGAQLRAAAQDAGSGIPAELLASDPALLSQEADRLFAAQRFPEAVTLYRKVLELDPSDAGSRNDLGLALHYAGNPQEGIEVLRGGADAAPVPAHLAEPGFRSRAGGTDGAGAGGIDQGPDARPKQRCRP